MEILLDFQKKKKKKRNKINSIILEKKQVLDNEHKAFVSRVVLTRVHLIRETSVWRHHPRRCHRLG